MTTKHGGFLNLFKVCSSSHTQTGTYDGRPKLLGLNTVKGLEGLGWAWGLAKGVNLAPPASCCCCCCCCWN